mmetsp:Transcript_57735/g.102459  ORF Transcript_57735/g.102459 Transcript_57735/m.102459 type:complete len:869 (-) Transcript_57735:27-2633(-)|eukprot:CAMPEP_0197632594 /NCGR_PEP_ID=MMETSP1338-20131121/9265_1 /TAXON_ID=43686 ORGANISM="Pelagodinium beii, Strain RCC1491" /NCGR_SAMPLE_ID=MMETSP1338 /ASSEMBLY_ACC=CAM_ASM_000754 /LENGTH=868 /DNA_ID=CAMNT_0043204157 /DNA_START=71 /DNA_END=2677 /DNA_ORIENTATION=+
MADNADEATLIAEREQIRRLQSDVARKTEDHERLQREKAALEDEIKTKTGQLEEITETFKTESKRAQKMKHAGVARIAEAENAFASSQVKTFLQARIPAMAPEPEPASAADAGFTAGPQSPAGDDGKQTLHDTVIVSHVNFMGDKKEEDYKVSYKIDANITVAQLLKDACAYWGCSRRDYCLCYVANDIPQDLSNRMEEKLQSELILDPAERAHVHLVRKVDMEQFKAQSQKMKQEGEKKRQKEASDGGGEAKEEKEGVLKTLKHGLGSIAAEANEPFVEALKPWPGIYNLLKSRNRKILNGKEHLKWHRTSLMDFCCFSLLLLLTGVAMACRSTTDVYFLREGVRSTLTEGIDGQSSGPVSHNMKGVKTVPMAMDYLMGTFDYQIFNNASNLRRSYEPVGAMRLRVQKVKTRTCNRPDIPDNVQRDCQHVQVSDSTQLKTDIFFPIEVLNRDANGDSILSKLLAQCQGDPRQWRRSTLGTEVVNGHVQQEYSGSGYQIWFPVNQQDLYNVTSKMSELDWLLNTWLTSDARMLAVELTLANYNLGGYVATTVLLEISASGAAKMNAILSPFHLAQTAGDQTASIIDGFRAAIVVGYLLILKVWNTCEEQVEAGGSGLDYVLSVTGFVDCAIIALFIADMYMLAFLRPTLDPTSTASNSDFVSYSTFARLQEQLHINEAMLLLLLITRCTMLMQFQPAVYRGYKTFKATLVMFGYYLTIFVPVMLSAIFLANCIWSPYVEGYSTWVRTFVSVVAIMQNVINPADLADMLQTQHAWTIVFLIYCYFVIHSFFVNGFLAISSWAYFSTELVEYSDPIYERWTRDQWMDWMLWGRLYTWRTGKAPGSSKKVGLTEDQEEEYEEEDEEEEDQL